jgi:predicted site-specific integrase-resolvase
MPSAKRKTPNFDHPVSIAVLADHLGISRQRVYNMIRRGEIRTTTLSGSLVVTPAEAARIADAAVRVDTRAGNRLAFDFV